MTDLLRYTESPHFLGVFGSLVWQHLQRISGLRFSWRYAVSYHMDELKKKWYVQGMMQMNMMIIRLV